MIEKIAKDGYMYLKDTTLAKIICVPNETALSDWKLITQEEADKIIQEQEEQQKLDRPDDKQVQ